MRALWRAVGVAWFWVAVCLLLWLGWQWEEGASIVLWLSISFGLYAIFWTAGFVVYDLPAAVRRGRRWLRKSRQQHRTVA